VTSAGRKIMTEETKKQRLQDALDEIRRCYHDAIAAKIQHSNKSYALIADEYGVSEQTVYTIGRERGISRNSQKRTANRGLPASESISTKERADYEH
jgi:ATP-dependent exoDNAse (exonuclease V) alpha subunit